ncbi:unnamed protein product [Gongylonema pulchrum]|uniref:Uncharacterized protein n=1 Tax=Gongylonema pulchrum TaxID=637853 RepID=A0A3P7R6W2_9BILA|nr:unnamed protein product [Gongylonema pulchrum]
MQVHCKSDCLSPELEESSDSGHTSGSGNAGTPAASASRTFQSSHRSSLLNPMYQQRFPRFQPSSAAMHGGFAPHVPYQAPNPMMPNANFQLSDFTAYTAHFPQKMPVP